MSNPSVRVRRLGKRYRIGIRQSRQRELLPRSSVVAGDGDRRSPHGDAAIWALRDVTFDVARGEALGIIGPNGAGKSTLLKILSRITEPTEGEAQIYGRVASLLEVGTGFHPELTGRENTFLNGVILGMKRAEVARRFDEIVEFSGIEQFIDTPVKRYSSGMYVRLAFAVAAHLEPEILIVDEVLAVGDAAFQRKCLGKMEEVAGSGRTVLFVSHNMAAIRAFTHRVLWLHDGQVRQVGDPDAVVQGYLAGVVVVDASGIFDATYLDANRTRLDKFLGQGRVTQVTLRDSAGEVSPVFAERSDVVVEVEFETVIEFPVVELWVRLRSVEGLLVFTCHSGRRSGRLPPGRYQARIGFNLGPLLPGTYLGEVWLQSVADQDRISPAFRLQVIYDPQQDAERQFIRFSHFSGGESAHVSLGVIRMNSVWLGLTQVS